MTNNALLSKTLNESTENRYRFLDNYDISEIKERYFDKDYSQAYEAWLQNIVIYRGDMSLEKQNHRIIGVVPGKRASQNTSNVYTSLFSTVLPSWKEYPRRDSSIVCTTNTTSAYNYAIDDIFVVFPKNNVSVAVCPRSDIWWSFDTICKRYRLKTLEEFNDDVIQFISAILDKDDADIIDVFHTTDVSQIINLFSQTQRMTKAKIKDYMNIQLTFDGNTAAEKFADEYLISDYFWISNNLCYDLIQNAYNGTLIRFFDKILSPEANNFKVGTIFDVPKENHEVWFSGPCLMISKSFLADYWKQMRKITKGKD